MEREDRDEAIAQFEAMLRIADDADVRNEASVAELNEWAQGRGQVGEADIDRVSQARVELRKRI